MLAYMEISMMQKYSSLPPCHSHSDYKGILWFLKLNNQWSAFIMVHFKLMKGFRRSLLHVLHFPCCFMFIQASWASLRTEFAALKPAQLHHMLREYSSGKACPTGWNPPPDEAQEAIRTGEWQMCWSYIFHFIVNVVHTTLCCGKNGDLKR